MRLALLGATLLLPGLALAQPAPAPEAPRSALTLEDGAPRLTVTVLDTADFPRLRRETLPKTGRRSSPPRCCREAAAAMDPEMVIVPDTSLHAYLRILRPVRDVDPGIFLPRPDLSGGCFGLPARHVTPLQDVTVTPLQE